MQFDVKSILTYLIMAILVVIIPVITRNAVKYFKPFISAKIEQVKNENLRNALIEVERLICQVVMEVSQTFVDALKKEGNFSELKQEEAFERARESILELIPDESLALIENTFGDSDLWLNTKIEQIVRSLKNQ